MNLSAVRHTGSYPDLYLRDRKTLVFTIHMAAGDTKSCMLVCFPRTDAEKRKYVPMECRVRDGRLEHFTAEVTFEDTARYQKYFFRITDREDKVYFLNAWDICETEPKDGFFEFLYANRTNVLEVPQWSKGQVYYQIFPERFCNGDRQNDPKSCLPWETKPTRENYMGGDLKGILSKMDYLQELGIECIYLNPIFSGDFNHKYATTDYFRIDPVFGTKKEFAELVEELHKRGIRILLDGVFNHCGVHFPAFQDLLKNQKESKYADWFYVHSYPVSVSETNAPYECVGDYGYMPKLNTANREVQEFIKKVMLYWLREFHIDGWRLDVADEVDATAWMIVRTAVKENFPDALLLGETWGDGLDMMDGKQMDSMMNYVFRDAVRDFIARESIDAFAFSHRICQMLSHYPEERNQVMFLPLDSHDTERFLFHCQGNREKLKLAAVFQMCFVGAPSVYYGDEIGMTGDNDPDCRRCMVWEPARQDRELLQHYKKLIQIRKTEGCIKTGKIAVNVTEGRVFGFIRYDGTEEICVICNAGGDAVSVKVPVFRKAEYENLLNGETCMAEPLEDKNICNADLFDYDGFLDLDLEAFEGKVMKRRKNYED